MTEKYPNTTPKKVIKYDCWNQSPGSVPEHMLLTAVLEMAIRDLDSDSKIIAMDAVRWFRKKTRGYITYKDCVEYLQLSSSRINKVEEKIESSWRRWTRKSPVKEESLSG